MTTQLHTHTVMFQRGTRVGARSLRMEYVTAANETQAVKEAKKLFPEWKREGYYVYRVKEEHYDEEPQWGSTSQQRIADHIDGYDRDDLGESPDF